MKLFLIALFVALATASPIPDDDGGPVEVVVNGLPEGAALDIGDLVDIKLKEHQDGQIVAATNLLHPFTAVGLAEAAAAAEAEAAAAAEAEAEAALPEPVVIPEPPVPEVEGPEVPVPEIPAIVNPEVPAVVDPEVPAVVDPEVPEIAVPEPEVVVPEPEISLPVIPEPGTPEVAPEVPEPQPVEVVDAVQVPNGEIFNDGLVSVTLNTPEPSIMSTLQGWLSMALNYISSPGVVTSHQIV